MARVLDWRCGALLVLCGGTLALRAELPVVRLTSVFPPGARAGSTVEVAVAGHDLDDSTRLVFAHPNIATLSNAGSKFTVTIESHVPAGIYDVRVAGRYGLSNPRAFVVGEHRELIEGSTNSSAAAAMEVPLGAVVNGRTEAGTADFFKVTLKAGQRIFVQCAAADIDSRCLPVTLLYDHAGREVARDRRGALLDFTAPADTTVLVKVHDFLFRGGPEYHYRLSIHSGPYIDFIYPAAVLPGSTNKHTIYGRNLPGGMPVTNLAGGSGLEQVPVEIHAPALAGPAHPLEAQPLDRLSARGFFYRLPVSNGVSAPCFIAFATAPVILEAEPNTRPEQAQKIGVPCEIAGQFYPAADTDWFVFDAQKGQSYWIEVFSQRMGCHTDPFLLVQRIATNGAASDVKELYDAEAVHIGGDVKSECRDPGWRLEVKEDGLYRLQVRDLFNRLESHPRHLYRLSIRPAMSFDLLVSAEVPPPTKSDAKDVRLWQPFLRRGETVPLRVTAVRRGYTEAIRVAAEGLPSGVKATDTIIPAGKNSTLLLLSAAADAPGWVGDIRVVGTGQTGAAQLHAEARGAMLVHPVEDKSKERLQGRLCDTISFAVSSNELAPITIEAAEDKVYELGTTGKVSIALKIGRNGDFADAFKLKPPSSSALDALPEFEVLAKATNAVVEIDLAKHKLGPGEHILFFRGQVKGKYRRNPEAVALAEQQLKATEKLVAELAAEIKKAEAGLGALSAEAKPLAEKAVAELKTRQKEAEARKTTADAALKQVNEKAKPQEVTVTVYSAPIRLRVKEEKKVAVGILRRELARRAA